MSIIEIAYSVGYDSLGTFGRMFLRYTGTTPRRYRQSTESAGVPVCFARSARFPGGG